MGVIFENGFGVGTVPNDTPLGSQQWYLATGAFGFQPAWTYGVISWPMNSGDGGSSYGTDNPNEILVNNSAGMYISKFDSLGTDQSSLLNTLVNNYGTITFTEGLNNVTFGFVPGSFLVGTSGETANSYFWSFMGPGSEPIHISSTSNTSFTGYSDGDNNNGELTYTGSTIPPNNTQLVTITINVTSEPPSFTITSNLFNTVSGHTSVCGSSEGDWNDFTGFTVTNASNLYCGVSGYLSGYTQIEAAFTSASAAMDYRGYIFDVVWGSGSTVTYGVAKLAYDSSNHSIRISTVNPTDIDYLNNNNNSGDSTSLTGTFNFPATFTFRAPVIDKGGWC
jgi:hypothetical protein